MKKIISILSVALCAIVLSSCAKPDVDIALTHDNYTITAISIFPATGSSSLQFAGSIDQENGTITWVIPKASRKKIDLDKVKVRATVGYDAFITPPLTGIKDLTEPLEITVTSRVSGNSKNYTLSASYAN